MADRRIEMAFAAVQEAHTEAHKTPVTTLCLTNLSLARRLLSEHIDISRAHPHCQLRLTRDIAPDSGWHWAVTMPDGHLYDVSKGPMTFEQALADMQKRGVVALDAADTAWRSSHPVPVREPARAG